MAQRFYGLDGLRGVCALTVVLFHLHIFRNGYLAVDMFFVLSGFVIALNYETRLQNGLGVKSFFRNRAKRLLPVFWLGSAVSLALIVLLRRCSSEIPINETFGWIVFANFLMIPQFVYAEAFAFPVNCVAWSLFGEWIANIFYALGMYRFRNRLLLLFAAMGMCIVWGLEWKGYVGVDHIPDLFRTACPKAISEFCGGVLLYRKRALFEKFPVVMPEVLFCVWLTIATLHIPTLIYDIFVVAILGPLLIALLIRAEARVPKWCAVAGRLSYPLYASHMAVIFGAQSIIGTKHINKLTTIAMVAAIMMLALALAWAIAWANDRIQGWLRCPAVG